jgi:hypothetical protein
MDSNKYKPNGGFPPIIKYSKAEQIVSEKNKNREFKSNKDAVSIKDIMEKRREITPFI